MMVNNKLRELDPKDWSDMAAPKQTKVTKYPNEIKLARIGIVAGISWFQFAKTNGWTLDRDLMVKANMQSSAKVMMNLIEGLNNQAINL